MNNYRPGVYSQYDISSLYSAANSTRYAAVVAKANSADAGVVIAFSSYQKAKEIFGADEIMLNAIQILFDCGVSQVMAVAVKNTDYNTAIDALAQIDEIGAVICDSDDINTIKSVKTAIHLASAALHERIGYFGISNVDNAILAAKALESERCVIVCPQALPLSAKGVASAFYTACAVAGTILAANDPVHNFSGEVLSCIRPPERLPEDTVQKLLAAGITVVEPIAEQVQIVRVLTTRVTVGGVEDRSMCSINTILVIDNILRDMRNALQLRLRGSRISSHAWDSIHAQVMVELALKRDNGIIEDFIAPKVYSHEDDPTVCVVELAFKVAHVLSQIHIVAHIQV